MRLFIVKVLVLACLSTAARGAEWQAASDFPGGSPRKLEVNQAEKTVVFTVTSDAGWKTWWYFKLSGLTAGEEVRLLPKGSNAARPVVSVDGGTWRFFDARKPVEVDGREARFAWYVPYVLADAKQLVAECERRGRWAQGFELCKSEAGEPVPALRIADPEAKPKPVVWAHARQHAWEVGGSWVAHGLAAWASSEDPKAVEFRKSVELIVVPIMDVDNVQRGNGGKDQKPHDHNRDWTDEPHWKSVAAAQAQLKELEDARRLTVFMDLHCPGWAGTKIDWWCNGLAKESDERRKEDDAFIAICKQEMVGPLSFGKVVDNGANYGGGKTSGAWVRKHTRPRVVAGTWEIPIPGDKTTEPPPAHHLLAGKQLGLVLLRYVAGEAVRD